LIFLFIFFDKLEVVLQTRKFHNYRANFEFDARQDAWQIFIMEKTGKKIYG